MPHSPSSVYAPSTSTESTQPGSPSSISPTSDSHRVSSYPTERTQDEPHHVGVLNRNHDDDNVGHEGMGAALLNDTYLSTEFGPQVSNNSLNRTATLPANRTQYVPSVTGRPRAGSVFPPAAPPPTMPPLPPPPDPVVPVMSATTPSQTSNFLETTRPHGNSIGHRQTGSGTRLTAVTKEGVRIEGPPTPESFDDQDLMASLPRRPDTPCTAIRDSHPLPPLPSPAAASYSVRSLESPAQQVITPRVRGESMSVISGQQLINTSLTMGTIHQRRAKMSAPPLTLSSTGPSRITMYSGRTIRLLPLIPLEIPPSVRSLAPRPLIQSPTVR
ncbi:hypothetical protein EV702DRAFT_1257112 [Suillus placidus]|uniref:Uncharacterized protein n=1 Tax=Suillus placidus TaxID=48579 RepID=A0A9P6ZH89_9AGAM|nr:hypothetical protein EV702DRAFT_1257112 [Suillus placidus]